VGGILKASNFTGFNPAKWEEMKAAIILFASENGLKPEATEEPVTS
jgi:hypothetical protein